MDLCRYHQRSELKSIIRNAMVILIYHRVDEHQPITSGHKGAIKEYRLEISDADAGFVTNVLIDFLTD